MVIMIEAVRQVISFSVSALLILKFSTASRPLFGLGRRPVVDSLPPNDLGRMNIPCLFCDALHWLDERVSSSNITSPEFGMCCAHGKIRLPFLRVPPQPLRDLFTGDTPQAKDFRCNIVQFNASLAFTSLGVKVDETLLNRGPPVFRIHGELRHLSGSLLPEESVAPCYSQLYIYDAEEAYRQRISRNDNLSLHTMHLLQGILSTYNAYSPIYHHAYEILHMYDGPDYTVRLCVAPGNDPRRYNIPTANEVGVILPGENVFQGDHRDIIIHLRPQHYRDPHDQLNHLQLQRISEGHAAYTPLHYVLLFPYGESGWYYELRCPNNSRRITLLQYTAYRIHSRPNEFSTILRGCRLFQRYLVDMFACIDQQRLYFIRSQQKRLRVTLLNGLEDALLLNDDQIDLNHLGQRIILPST